jgi:hypothetical protein
MNNKNLETELQNELLEIDRAIKSLKLKQTEAIINTSIELPKPREYYVIDTQVKRVACPVCFEDVAETMLRRHMASECKGNEIICPSIGCKERMPACDLSTHIQQKCRVVKRRKWLAKQSKVREVENQINKAKNDAEEYKKRNKSLNKNRVPPPVIDESFQTESFQITNNNDSFAVSENQDANQDSVSSFLNYITLNHINI